MARFSYDMVSCVGVWHPMPSGRRDDRAYRGFPQEGTTLDRCPTCEKPSALCLIVTLAVVATEALFR
jgi:hypothetical protein